MSAQLDKIINAYKTLAKIPSIAGARLNKTGGRVTAKWSVRNLDKGKQTKYLYNYLLGEKLEVVSESEFGVDVSNELLSSVSPSNSLKAVIREEKDSKDAKKQYLEVWQSNTLAHSIDLTALDIHGDVYADSEFGTLDWSKDESSLVYIAEKKPVKSEAYIKRKPAKDTSTDDGSGEAAPRKGEEFWYKQDWGEQLVGKYMSVVVVCRLREEAFHVLELPGECSPGQAIFLPSGDKVVGVAWETEPRRLGLIFCTNRPSFIFTMSVNGEFERLTPAGVSVRSPSVCPPSGLVWLQRTAGGPHHAGHQLVSADIEAEKRDGYLKTTTLIDIVEKESTINNNIAFKGLYCLALPKNCFSTDGKRVLLSTPQQTEVKSYVLDIDSKTLTELPGVGTAGSLSVLDVQNDVILATYSSMTTPGQLYVAKLPPKGKEGTETVWLRISRPTVVPSSVAASHVEYMDLKHEGVDDEINSFTSLFFSPESEKSKVPLIVWPHGGPHSGFVNAFSIEAALFAMLGFASVLINYRGSTGNGEASLRYLLKRVGDADVKDCKYATDACVQKYNVDGRNLFLVGGSHGGFLVTHLSGQYPDLYRAVATRNPVTDVASMINSTDIADWCAVEAGFEFTEKGPVSEEQLLAMRRCSPMAHVHRVKAPTALMLGSVDKRVPYYQGLEYYRRLKANGVEVRLYMYEDNHSLSSLPSEMDNLINGARWFIEHLQ